MIRRKTIRDSAKVIAALDSSTRRSIISIIGDDKLKLDEIFKKLDKKDSGVKYRETVYRATEKLVDAGIVEKFYNNQKSVCYKVAVKKIEIDLVKSKIRDCGDADS